MTGDGAWRHLCGKASPSPLRSQGFICIRPAPHMAPAPGPGPVFMTGGRAPARSPAKPMTCSSSDTGFAPYILFLKTTCFNDTGKRESYKNSVYTHALPVTTDSAARAHTVLVDVNRTILYVLFSKLPCSHHGSLMFINFSWPLPPLFCHHFPDIPFPILSDFIHIFALVYLSLVICKSRCSNPAECHFKRMTNGTWLFHNKRTAQVT